MQAMVRVVDEGSHFDAPIAKVWKLIDAHGEHLTEIHTDLSAPKFEELSENQGELAFMAEMNGQKVPVKIRTTALPPLAQTLELLDGPLAGSKMVNYYTPKGDKTAVTVVGDFESPMLPPHQIEGAARDFLDRGFNADQAYLKRMK